MKRVCFVLRVKPERLEDYKQRQRVVWPEMRAALRETGCSNYSLFLRPDGLLDGNLETADFDPARAEMAKREVHERWQWEMADFFQPPEGTLPDRAMVPLEEVVLVALGGEMTSNPALGVVLPPDGAASWCVRQKEINNVPYDSLSNDLCGWIRCIACPLAPECQSAAGKRRSGVRASN